jgi:hypothetical protein
MKRLLGTLIPAPAFTAAPACAATAFVPAPAVAFVDAIASVETGTTAARLGNCRTVQGGREKHRYRWRCNNGKLSAGRQKFAAILVGVIGSVCNFRHPDSYQLIKYPDAKDYTYIWFR